MNFFKKNSCKVSKLKLNLITTSTNLTTTWFFKFQNYCDNETIFVIFTTLKYFHFVLQFWLNIWKLYVIVDLCAKNATIAKIEKHLKWFWRMFRLKIWIFNWWKLSNLNNKISKLIKIFLDRSFVVNDFNEYFIIKRFYLNFVVYYIHLIFHCVRYYEKIITINKCLKN